MVQSGKMFKNILLPLVLSLAAVRSEYVASSMQLAEYRDKTTCPIGILTTGAGAPVEYKEATNTLNTELLDNEHLIDSFTHVVRKVNPERVFHAVGTGAFGYFETLHDITHLCKAKMFSEIGKKTSLVSRFSIGFSSIGAPDTGRETRGMAVKFYTEEGNFDITTLNFPVFPFKDPVQTPTLSAVLRRNPVTNLPDPNMLWDYAALRPETLFILTRLFSYEGMPLSYSHMQGFSIHTYQVYNATGHSHFLRWNFLPERGVQYFNLTGFSALGTTANANYYGASLYNDVVSSDPPSWLLRIQVVPECDVKNHEIDVFDPTQELLEENYPYQVVGRVVLDKWLDNFYAQNELLAFAAGNMVPGILGGPEALFQTRRCLYRDAQNARLGANYKQIPVNYPWNTQTYNYMRDGVPPVGDNGGSGPNYYPNSFNGPIPYVDETRPSLIKITEAAEPRNYEQTNKFIMNLSCDQRAELIEALVAHMSSCVDDVKERVVEKLRLINTDFADEVAEGLANYAN